MEYNNKVTEHKNINTYPIVNNKYDDTDFEITETIENPPYILNFYGCSFNFANDGCAESRYYNGDDIYNPRKEV